MITTVYQLILMAYERATETDDLFSAFTYKAMLEIMTLEEAMQPAPYYGIL